MSNDTIYSMAFSHAPGIGPMLFDSLCAQFDSVKSAYSATHEELSPLIGESKARSFLSFRNTFSIFKTLQKYKYDGISVLSRFDTMFPAPLKNISDIPICLYVKGNISAYDFENDFYFAVVGTRKPTSYGIEVTNQLSTALSRAGAVIVSGMAIGIDALAHSCALKLKKRTIAVLGCGVNIVYPQANTTLYQTIIAQDGLVVSEFPPDMRVKKGMFVSRNRLVSGLSRGVLVVEGTTKSGSLITARNAGMQGKDLFAVPAPITSSQSGAPNLLIREGAVPVTSADDILNEYHLTRASSPLSIQKNLSEDEKTLVTLLSQESFTADDLARKIDQPVHEVLAMLSTMELSGIISKSQDGTYQIHSLM